MISPMYFALTMSGGVSLIFSPAGRVGQRTSKNASSSARMTELAGLAFDGREIRSRR